MGTLSPVLRHLFALNPHANQTELAAFVGVTPQAVQQWMSGKTQPSRERLERIAAFFGIDKNDLADRLVIRATQTAEHLLAERLREKGWKVVAPIREDIELPEIFQRSGLLPDLMAQQDGQTLYLALKSRPLGERGVAKYRRWLSLAQRAGNLIVADPGEWETAVSQAQAWLEARQSGHAGRSLRLSQLKVEELENDWSAFDFISEVALSHENAYALLGRRDFPSIKLLNMRGDAMAPTINHRDLLFIDTSITAFKEDGLYSFVLEGSLLVRRLQKKPDGRTTVKSDNPAYEDFVLESPQDKISIVGQVIASLPIRVTLFS